MITNKKRILRAEREKLIGPIQIADRHEVWIGTSGLNGLYGLFLEPIKQYKPGSQTPEDLHFSSSNFSNLSAIARSSINEEEDEENREEESKPSMLHSLLNRQSKNYQNVYFVLRQTFRFTGERPFSVTSTSPENCQPVPSSPENHNLKDLTSVNFAGVAKTVILKADKGENSTNLSFKDYLLRLSTISPGFIRRFWRKPELKPQEILEILQGFEFKDGKHEIEAKKSESLWGIFKWASERNRVFQHLPQSCKIMASMLVQAGLFREAEFLLSGMEIQGISLDCKEIFSSLIEGYVGEFDLDRAISIYDRMRELCLVPSLSSYQALVKYLVESCETQLAYRVYVHALEMGMEMKVGEEGVVENLLRLLCVDGRVQEARNLAKKVMTFGIEQSRLVMNAICKSYIKKKDYDDLLGFLAEFCIPPDFVLGNEIVFSLGRDFGVERASLYVEEMEKMGFIPNERTFGILISWGCREGKLRDSFLHFSKILSRELTPHLYSYNALLSGIFKAGLWRHSRDILHEMYDRGVTPDLSTLRVVLAGFCKERQFGEMKEIASDMVEFGWIDISLSEDLLNKSFALLGLDPLGVKIIRDNDKGFSKAEFFDSLGNGLYLDTDVDEYDKTLTKVLDDAMIPNFNSLILEHCGSRGGGKGNTVILNMIDEMASWGQDLTLPLSSIVVKRLCGSPFSTKAIDNILEKTFGPVYQLDGKTLNKLVQAYSKNGFPSRARILLRGMVRRHHVIENETFTTQLMDLCNEVNLEALRECLLLARQCDWTPKFNHGIVLLGRLCENKWLNEALVILEILLIIKPQMISTTFHAFLEKLCGEGFTTTAYILVEQLSTIFDQRAYGNLIRGFCKERRFEEALTICDSMLANNLSPPLDVSTLLVPRLCTSNYFEKALTLKDLCLKDQPSAFLSIHLALMNGFCKSGRVDEATHIFKKMALEEMVVDSEAYNMLVKGYCQVNNLEKTKELLGVMIRKDLSISVPRYRDLVCLMCRKGKFHLALSLKVLMLEETSLVLYNITMFYLFLSGRTVLVNVLIDELQAKGLQFDEVTYNFVIQGFLRGKDKDISSSLQYLTIMIGEDLRPSNRSLREVISYLCDNGEVMKALKLSQEMESRCWVHCSTVQNKIFEALSTRDNLDKAVYFLDRMMTKGLTPDNIKYDYVIKRLCQHDRLEKAVELLNTMLKKGSLPDSTSFDYVIQGFINLHNLDMAMDFHAEMMCRGLKPSRATWDHLVCRSSEDGRVGEAEVMLYSMIRLGETPSKEMFCSVIDKYRSRRNVGKVSELLELMQEHGYSPDFDTHWSLISNLSSKNGRTESKSGRGFLSGLLSGFGFVGKKPGSKNG